LKGIAVEAVSKQARITGAKESPWSGLRLTTRLSEMAYSFADQALSVGGMFLANVTLARTQSKEEYGLFALCYSIYLFLAGLHSAAVVEPYTVFGSGRYRSDGTAYLRLMARSNLLAGVASSALLLLACAALRLFAPEKMPKALLGMGLAIAFLLNGIFLRRALYVQGRAGQAAKASLIFFVTVTGGVWLAKATGRLDGFTVFVILALGWIAASLGTAKQFLRSNEKEERITLAANYWREHWGYARWSLSTAFLAQLVLQGYYWLTAGLLSVRDVADLRAMTILIAPVEQIFIALNYLVLPRLAAIHDAGQRQEFLRLWKRYALAILSVTSAFVLGARLTGLQVMRFVYAGKFDGLFPLLTLLAFLPLVMGVGHTINAALKAMERPKLVFYGYVSSGVMGAIVGVPLVARFGVRGAVYGILLAGLAYTGALGVGFLAALRNEEKKHAMPEAFFDNKREPIVAEMARARTAASGKPEVNGLAPIALFVYNREEHTRRTVDSLRANDLAAESDLYVFSDGAKNAIGESQVHKVREYLRTIDGFRSVTVVERKNNAGLANAVIEGVTRLCRERGRLIAMEDDLLTTPDFLTFMNQALMRYEHEQRIFSVSGFNFALRTQGKHPWDVFTFYRSSSLGWGTWRNRWEKADWTVATYPEFKRDKKQQKKFNRGGQDLSGMLALQMDGWIDSWAIRWAYEHCRHDALALLSFRPRVFHIGDDGTGTHTGRGGLRQSALTTEHKTRFLLPDQLEPHHEFVASLQKSLRPSNARKMVRYALRKWRSRKQLFSGRIYAPAMPSGPRQKEQESLQ
jgi:O-antigen/teichoic acid export membrane protein